MTLYRRWIFEANATREEFLHQLGRALARRGFGVAPGKVFDMAIVGNGGRGWIKVLHHAQGLDLVLKERSGLFGNTAALEAAVLEAGREAQANILKGSAQP